MSQEYLDFELPIAELEAKIESLRSVAEQDDKINLDDEIARLQKKSVELTQKNLCKFRRLASFPHGASSKPPLHLGLH